MKSIIQISMLLFYLVFNAGLSYSLHYCGEEVAAINLYNEDKTCCPDEEEMPGCCDDVPHTDLQNAEQSLSKIIDGQFAGVIVPADGGTLLNTRYIFGTQSLNQSPYYHEGAPPLISVPLFIIHQVFLI